MGPIPLVLAAVCEKGLRLHNPVFEDCLWQELCSLLSPKAYVGFRVCACKSSTSVQKLRKELIGAEESCRRKCGHDPHGSAIMQLSLRPSVWPCMGQVQSALMQLSLRPSVWPCRGKSSLKSNRENVYRPGTSLWHVGVNPHSNMLPSILWIFC